MIRIEPDFRYERSEMPHYPRFGHLAASNNCRRKGALCLYRFTKWGDVHSQLDCSTPYEIDDSSWDTSGLIGCLSLLSLSVIMTLGFGQPT
jgi:hypothetical protein